MENQPLTKIPASCTMYCSNPMKKNTAKKFNHSLGALEAEIMNISWCLGGATVRQVLDEIKKKKNIAYTTVMTVMCRLWHKNILKRKLDAFGAYVYVPAKDKEAFLAATSKKAISQLIKDCGAVAVAQFIDVIETSNAEDLKKWREKLKGIK